MKLAVRIGVFMLMVFNSCFADVGSNLNHFFNGLGFASNASSPTAYEGQSAGYYTGGSMYLRDTVVNMPLVHVQLPSVNAGCGGIDLHLGGFSFINSEGVITLSKNIMSNAKTYGFQLALQQDLPQATNTERFLQGLSNRINNLQLNSCHAAKQLVGAIGLKTQSANLNVCESAALSMGQASGWSEAVTLCQNPASYQKIMAMAQHNPDYSDLVAQNVNVAWKALQQTGLTQGDVQLSELLMSLSGSIIETQGNTQYLTSMAQNKTLIKTLLKGGQATIWACDTTDANGCLHPRQSTLSIPPEDGLENQVVHLLNDISDKIETDTALTQQEIGFLNSTRLPVYKMLNVQAATMGGSNILDVTSYADVIATSIIYQYLHENLTAVKAASLSLQYPPSLMKAFNAGINTALNGVRAQEHSAWQRITLINSMVERTKAAERTLSAGFTNQLYQSMQWARGLS